MPQHNLLYRLISATMIALLLSASVSAQNNGARQEQTPKPDAAPAAPIPAQILAAKQVFVSNAPGVTIDLPGGPNCIYDRFYAAIKSLQKYQLASTPAAADLAFEISITRQIAVIKGDSREDFELRLVIVDPKTNIPLWNINQHIEPAIRKATAERNLENAIAQLLNQLKRVTSPDAGGTQ